MREADIIQLLKGVATSDAARGLADDAAVWAPPVGRELVLTHDTIVEAVHYLPGDRPSDIAWKMVAVNLSDLAAKGAIPAGLLTSFALGDEDEDWLRDFAAGLARVCDEFGVELWGGDTVRTGRAAVLGCTAIGHVEPGRALSRGRARVGDDLYVSGTIGDAGLGLAIAKGEAPPDKELLRSYRLPMPRLALGRGLSEAGATAAMDVSDGLLLDAKRMAAASAVGVRVDLRALPLSGAALARLPEGEAGRLAAATSGDDYELLFSAPPEAKSALQDLADRANTPVCRIGVIVEGGGLDVVGADERTVVPERLGFSHDA